MTLHCRKCIFPSYSLGLRLQLPAPQGLNQEILLLRREAGTGEGIHFLVFVFLVMCNGCFGLVFVLCSVAFSAVAGSQKRWWQTECSSLKPPGESRQTKAPQISTSKGSFLREEGSAYGPGFRAEKVGPTASLCQALRKEQKGAGPPFLRELAGRSIQRADW